MELGSKIVLNDMLVITMDKMRGKELDIFKIFFQFNYFIFFFYTIIFHFVL